MKIIEIIGIIITFIVCTIIGYYMPIPEFGKHISKNEIEDSLRENLSNDSETIVDVENMVESDLNATEETVVSSAPYNINAIVGVRSPKYYTKIGFPLTVSAEVETGDELECLIKENDSSDVIVAQSAMTNGKCAFPDIPPVDGGRYYICVRNTVTGEFTGIYQDGFNKISKWSAAELTKQLNASHLDDLFFFHFDTKKLTFDCEGIDQSEVPKSLDRLRTSRSGYGWTFTVTETPKYDQYNRITYFKVNITD